MRTAAVYALAVSGGTVYAGGDFTSIGGQPRNYIAALDAASGAATSWNPNANGPVFVLALSGATFYAGGEFTSIGGQTRGTGSPRWMQPPAPPPPGTRAPNGCVFALAVSGGTVYAGGYFNSIGGQPRNSIAALDAASGAATAWNPNANGDVHALAVSGGTVYAGGQFTSIGGQPRNRIAALDAASSGATAWNPNAERRGLRPGGERRHGVRGRRLHQHRRAAAGISSPRSMRPAAPPPPGTRTPAAASGPSR